MTREANWKPSSFKCDDLSALKTFMHGSPSPHQYILGSDLTFKCDYLFALKTSCVGPLNHTSIRGGCRIPRRRDTNIWFCQIFQKLHEIEKILGSRGAYTWGAPLGSATDYTFISSSKFKCDDLSALKTFMFGSPSPHNYILGSVLTFKCDGLLHLNIYVWVPSTTPLYLWFSFNIQVWWPFSTKTFMHCLHHT